MQTKKEVTKKAFCNEDEKTNLQRACYYKHTLRRHQKIIRTTKEKKFTERFNYKGNNTMTEKEKTCWNCKYREYDSSLEPCASCELHLNWKERENEY